MSEMKKLSYEKTAHLLYISALRKYPKMDTPQSKEITAIEKGVKYGKKEKTHRHRQSR